MLTNVLVRDYLLNYARTLIFTTSLSYANIVAANCSFDMLSDGTATLVSLIVIDPNEGFIDFLTFAAGE
jgi:8-amino-7-oxononanoate synthase